ncbi:hypothetical protein BGW80DRAFT_715351 [Lactifluus volemus]|nr:hypothetical protein BGW80DRAFT_715351 [Lactifluus volemus]
MHPSITLNLGDGNFCARGRYSFAAVKEVFRKPVPQCSLLEDFSIRIHPCTNPEHGTMAVGNLQPQPSVLSCSAFRLTIVPRVSPEIPPPPPSRPLLAVGWCRLNRSTFTQSQYPVTGVNGAPGEMCFNQRSAFLLQVIRFFRNVPQIFRTSNSSCKGPRPSVT